MMKSLIFFNDSKKIFNFKLAIIITVIFFLSTSYVAFVIDVPSQDSDFLYYYYSGKQILDGNKENVAVTNAPVGWPILLASLETIVNDPFIAGKIYSVLGATGIVFFSYLIIREIFDSKIAILTQTIITINPFLHSEAIITHNEMLPVFFIFISLYFITKKQLFQRHIVLTGFFLGISFSLRYQSLFVFIGILIFLVIINKEIPKKFLFLFVFVFLLTISPLLVYNFENTGNLLDSDPSFYLSFNSKYKTPDMETSAVDQWLNISESKFIPLEILLQNYFYNLFLNNPHNIFNLGLGWDSSSPIPIIPVIGILFILGGTITIFNYNISKKQLYIIIIELLFLSSIILATNNFGLFFSLIIIPITTIGIFSFKKLENNIKALLIIFSSFMILISFAAINVPWDLFSILLIPSTLTSIFIAKTVPNTLSKFINYHYTKIFIIILISLIIIANLFFSFMLEKFFLYEDSIDYKNILSNENLILTSIKFVEIGNILSNEPDIESKYVMSDDQNFHHYANSKSIFVTFKEGSNDDDLSSYITRENWSVFEIASSNVASFPSDRYGKINPLPNYIIYEKNDDHNKNLQSLAKPESSEIPSNFESIFISNQTGIIIYKIHYIDD